MANTAPNSAGPNSAGNAQSPMLYRDLVPLSAQQHAEWRIKPMSSLNLMAHDHAVPLTIDEFAVAQRHFPIIFSVGDAPVPLALLGLNEGVNTFVNDEGALVEAVYVPAYVRRYPFMLARLRPDAQELSLCADPSSGLVGAFEEGEKLFDNGEPSAATKSILEFCEQFEQAGQRTGAFVQELKDHDLLMEGEVSIQTDADTPPFIYRGFQMVNEEKLRDLRGDVLRKMMQSGLLPLVHAHLFSLSLMRDLFGRQLAQGKLPQPLEAAAQA